MLNASVISVRFCAEVIEVPTRFSRLAAVILIRNSKITVVISAMPR